MYLEDFYKKYQIVLTLVLEKLLKPVLFNLHWRGWSVCYVRFLLLSLFLFSSTNKKNLKPARLIKLYVCYISPLCVIENDMDEIFRFLHQQLPVFFCEISSQIDFSFQFRFIFVLLRLLIHIRNDFFLHLFHFHFKFFF